MQMTVKLVPSLIWVAAGALIFYLLHQLIPFIACRLNHRLYAAMGVSRIDLGDFGVKGLPPPVQNWLKNQLIRAGLRKPSHLRLFVWGLTMPPFLLALVALMAHASLRQGFLLGLLISFLLNGWLNQRIQARRRAFQLSLYKVYRFLDLQLTSGIKAMDVLKGLADVMDQPLIRPDFQRFCAQLELTLDLDRALLELEAVFAGPDMNLLASQLRNSLQTGVIGQTFFRMESLMFNRHIALIQAKSKQIRTGLLLVGLLALIPIEIIFIYPIVAQALTSFGQLFGP